MRSKNYYIYGKTCKVMKNIKVLLFAITLCFALTACSDSAWKKATRFGGSYNIQLVNCDGSITHSWVSTGAVNSSKESDGYYFKDRATGTLVEVSGNVIITDN